MLEKAAQHWRQHIAARAARHVVEHQGQIHCLGNGLEMQIQAFLGGLVVIGGDQQRAVGPGLFGKEGQADGFAGIVGTGPGQHRHPAFGLIDTDFNDPLVFLVGQRGGFAGGAARHQTVDAFGDLAFDKGPVGLFIHGIILERGDKRCHRTGKKHVRLLMSAPAASWRNTPGLCKRAAEGMARIIPTSRGVGNAYRSAKQRLCRRANAVRMAAAKPATADTTSGAAATD